MINFVSTSYLPKKNISNRVIATLLAVSLLATAGCGISKKRLKQIGAVVVIGVAAKLIYDMVVDYQSKQVNDEGQVVKKYKKAHGKLPQEAVLVEHKSDIKPGEVVEAGGQISIVSNLEVVRSANSKELKSLTKVVNEDTNASGAFQNEFTFKLPKGLPQGVYPVQSIVIVNGIAQTPVNSQMQLI